MKKSNLFYFCTEKYNHGKGNNQYCLCFVFMAIHRETLVLEGKMLYSGSRSETHLWIRICIKPHFHTALQQLTYDILAVLIALITHIICW